MFVKNKFTILSVHDEHGGFRERQRFVVHVETMGL